MDIELKPGTYVIAVSGGVDSMVLLDLLKHKPGLRLIVAHFDHGIRPDSHLDRKLVQDVTARHNVPFVHVHAGLGPATSEEKARKARYEFLNKVKKASGADAIITAHHNDDLVETAIHNIMRGTGRKGLSSLTSQPDIIRPLLKFPKRELQEYGKSRGLAWREDSTNQDTKYRRNYIRHKIVPRMGEPGLSRFKELVEKTHKLNKQVDFEIAKVLQKLEGKKALSRLIFINLPHAVAREIMAEWLRRNGIRQFDRKTLERLVVAAKTYKTGKKADIDSGHQLSVGKGWLKIVSR